MRCMQCVPNCTLLIVVNLVMNLDSGCLQHGDSKERGGGGGGGALFGMVTESIHILLQRKIFHNAATIGCS